MNNQPVLQVGDFVKVTYLNGRVATGKVEAMHVHEPYGVTAYKIRHPSGEFQWFAAASVKRIAHDGTKEHSDVFTNE